jgi:hypothetical protein
MLRRFQFALMIALVAISFITLGKAPRMPEPRGVETLEMTQRAGARPVGGRE